MRSMTASHRGELDTRRESCFLKIELKLERNTAMLKGIGEEAVVYKLTALVQ